MRHVPRLALCIALLPLPVYAEVVQSAPDSALIEHHFQVRATPAEAWQSLIHPERSRPIASAATPRTSWTNSCRSSAR